MTPALPAACALALVGILTGYALWWRHHKRQANRVYSWTEWAEPRRWDTYGWHINVDPRPMEVGQDID